MNNTKPSARTCPCCGRDMVCANFDPSEPLVYRLTAQNNSAELSKLLGAGADPNAYKQQDSGMVTPLHRAASYNAIESARVLLHYGACINARDSEGHTPLHMVSFTQAAFNGHVDFVKFLLSHGAHKLCSRNCVKCRMYCKLASRCVKPQPTPAFREVVDYSSDEELDFSTQLQQLKRILGNKVITRAGKVVPFY